MASGSSIRPSSSRESVGSLIQQYFLQLTRGCGQEGCSNSDCATGSGKPLDPNQAAARAMSLAEHKRKGRLCIAPNSVSESKPFIRNSSSKTKLSSMENNRTSKDREGDPSTSSSSSSSQLQPEPMDTTDTAGGVHYSSSTDSVASSTLIFVTSRSGASPSPSRAQLTRPGNAAGESSSAGSIEMELLPPFADKKGTDRVQKPPTPSELSIPFLTETKVRELIERARVNGSGQEDYKELTNTIWLVFSSPDSLNQSFLLPEDRRTEICTEAGITVDVKAVRSTYDALFNLQVDAVKNTMINAMDMYCSTLKRTSSILVKEPLNHIVVLFENPLLHSPEFISTFPKFLQSFTSLSPGRKEALVRWYSHYPVEEIKNFVSSLQQLITLQLLFSDDSEHQRMYIPQSDPAITSATSIMVIFFFADLLAAKRMGEMRPMSEELSSVAAKPKPEFMQTDDAEYEKLLCRLKIHPANALKVPIPFGEFLNEELNGRIHMGIDYQREYQTLTNGERAFSFLEHPFVLSTDNKVEKMFRDNLFNQYSERQRTLVHSVLTGVPDLPFLLLRIDRSNIVSDALVQLEAISDLNPIDLRKQLRVDFKGEEGIDEGGLQKEFFQLIIEQLFDPMNGMFTYDEDTQVHWFNPMSFESKEQYRLIGLLLGLAIYNNIILDIHFPMVIYHKLIGCNTVFSDLYSSHPVETDSGSFLVTLCFAFSLLGRRMFFQHAQTGASRRGGDNFMNGLYRMFLGDARPNSPNDEWVFADVDSIQEIIIPAARIALKVHQDNFTFSEDYETTVGVYEAIKDVEENHVVTHENDRAWRNAVVMNKPSLLALRYQRTEESYIYPYKLIRLSSKFIKFKVIKLNRECVRALWTSQQHELIFLRNHDSERGSIQNHKQTLRNMINSSMDLPIGYPIYVSPLQTSFADRHETYNSTFLGKISNPLEIAKAVDVIKGWCETCAKHYQGSRSQPHPKGSPARQPGEGAESQMQETESVDSLTGMQYGGQDYEDPFPDSDSDSELWKPMWVSKLIVIVDASEIFETFNVNWLKWPDSHWAQKAMKSSWKSWRPQEGMEGEVVHEWRPFHIDSTQRSHIDKVILLVKMAEEHEHYVLVREQGVKEV